MLRAAALLPFTCFDFSHEFRSPLPPAASPSPPYALVPDVPTTLVALGIQGTAPGTCFGASSP